jgi:hypothetical protein
MKPWTSELRHERVASCVPGIDRPYASALEVARITRNDGEIVGQGGRRDKGIDSWQESARTNSLSYQSRPSVGNFSVDQKDPRRKPQFQVGSKPQFKLGAPPPLGKKFDALLDFSQRKNTYVLQGSVRRFKPVPDTRIGASGTAIFGQNVCIDRKTVHSISTGRG